MAAIVLLGAGGAAVIGSRDGATSSPHSSAPKIDENIIARTIALRTLDPTLSAEVAAGLAADSKRWREALAAQGTTARAALARIPVSEEEARLWFESHRAVFGRRSLDEERSNVVTMVRLAKFQAMMNHDAVP